MAEVARGEIWMFSFPKPDKKRPVLVLTRQDMIGRLHMVTVAPITSTKQKSKGFDVIRVHSWLLNSQCFTDSYKLFYRFDTIPR